MVGDQRLWDVRWEKGVGGGREYPSVHSLIQIRVICGSVVIMVVVFTHCATNVFKSDTDDDVIGLVPSRVPCNVPTD